ncbi:MAG: GTP-binding protein [Candidatus Heimdallarchaeota archaeon]|nr:GTP-binding protein [Candidatus Heimdallarchaeota archaeon]
MSRIQPDYNFKILLLGDAAVGKTSLVQKFVHDKFAESYLMTIGMEPSERFVTLKNGTIVALSIWDLAGQERFRFIRHTFYRGAKAALLVFDLTRDSTLKNVKKWNQEFIDNCGKETHTLLIGNKNDLQNKIAVSDDECQKMNTKIKGFDFIKTSALTGEQVEDAFTKLAGLLVMEK